MSNEKKNPLIGAFRAPPVGTPPSPTQPAKQPETPKNVKAPATPLSAPILTKLEESKKTVEPAKDDKAVKDGKPAADAPAPTKPEESKKPAEPAKDDNVKFNGSSIANISGGSFNNEKKYGGVTFDYNVTGTISGGTFTFADFYTTKVKLSGGTFTTIKTNGDRKLADLLAEGAAYYGLAIFTIRRNGS